MKKIFSVLVLLSLLFIFCAFCAHAMKVPDPAYYEMYTVQKGDNLWEIARQSDMWNKVDASYIIEDMKTKSNCSSTIYPGQIVYIPMYND